MKLLAFLLLTGFIMIGCASSEKDDNSKKSFENLVTLQPPNKEAKEANIYIDSVSVVQQEGKKALLVSGNFPDGCTRLRQALHSRKEQTVQLSLLAWRDPDMMCTQALTPFSFIYDELAENDIEALTSVTVNGTNYELK